MNLNKVILCGNLTRDPEVRYTPNGLAVAAFGVATNRTWNDPDGNRQDEVEYHNIVVFGKQAETAGEYLKRGQIALIEGRIQSRSWEQDGVKRSRTEIVAERIQFGPKRSGKAAAPADEAPDSESEDDAIPF